MTGGRRDEETQLQIAAVNFMRICLPPGAIIHHSHNEGKRSKADAGRAKAMGQCAGFPDMLILHNARAYFVEFKTQSPNSRQTKSQRAVESMLADTGFPHYAIVRSLDDLCGVLKAWGLLARSVGGLGRAQLGAGQKPP